MAIYAAVEGSPKTFISPHCGRLVLGGAGCRFVEATAVTDQRPHYQLAISVCGLRRDAPSQAHCRLHAGVRRCSGIQIAHAGREGPCNGLARQRSP